MVKDGEETLFSHRRTHECFGTYGNCGLHSKKDVTPLFPTGDTQFPGKVCGFKDCLCSRVERFSIYWLASFWKSV